MSLDESGSARGEKDRRAARKGTMMSAEMPEVRWPAGFRMRPAADPESARVEVTDAVTGRRFHWSPETLSGHILRGDPDLAALDDGDEWKNVLKAAGERRALLHDWRHWQERRWHPSDHYYLASRLDDPALELDTGEPALDPDTSELAHDSGTSEPALDAYSGEPVRPGAVQSFPLTDGSPVRARTDGPPPEWRPDGTVLQLGTPPALGGQEIARLLVNRRTGRSYIKRAAPLDSLSGLLWYGLADARDAPALAGHPDRRGSAWDFYLCVYKVEGVEPGVYRYDAPNHQLVGVRPGDHRDAMIDVLQGMHSPATATWTLGLVADFARYQWRYRSEHGLRRLYLEAGVLGQQLIVLAMSYGLSTLVTPAQKDRAYLDLHALPEDRFAPVYTLTMGLSRGGAGVGFDNAPGAS
jgi:SagB-type dehydrogenase family enzyme